MALFGGIMDEVKHFVQRNDGVWVFDDECRFRLRRPGDGEGCFFYELRTGFNPPLPAGAGPPWQHGYEEFILTVRFPENTPNNLFGWKSWDDGRWGLMTWEAYKWMAIGNCSGEYTEDLPGWLVEQTGEHRALIDEYLDTNPQNEDGVLVRHLHDEILDNFAIWNEEREAEYLDIRGDDFY